MKEDKKEEKVKMSYSAMAGELRKHSRMYEVFKNASEAADILATHEKDEEALKRRIGILGKELNSLDLACDESYAKAKKAEKVAADAELKAADLLKRARHDVDILKDKAASHAADVKLEVEGILDGIRANTLLAKNELNDAVNAKGDAVNALSKVEKQIQSAKDRFLKTLG